jgi:hypothetical protein
MKTDQELEEEGKGRCDECGSIHAIDRGDNFKYNEATGIWLCLACADKADLDEWGYPKAKVEA